MSNHWFIRHFNLNETIRMHRQGHSMMGGHVSITIQTAHSGNKYDDATDDHHQETIDRQSLNDVGTCPVLNSCFGMQLLIHCISKKMDNIKIPGSLLLLMKSFICEK